MKRGNFSNTGATLACRDVSNLGIIKGSFKRQLELETLRVSTRRGCRPRGLLERYVFDRVDSAWRRELHRRSGAAV